LLHFELADAHVGLWWLSVPFTVFALLCLKNGLNMADGVDGLAPGIVLGWFALILPWAQGFAPEVVPIVLVALAAMLVVFAFNWVGAVFLGDAGSYGLSFLAGVLGIYVYNRAGGALPAELVALWFLIPVLDMGRLLVQRRASGRHPFEPDRNHLHHLLLQAMDKRSAVLLYLTLVVAPPALVTLEIKLLPFAIAGSFAGYLGMLALGRRAPARRLAAVHE
jgi:UDP-GlcNAc:undecaprenyl-phosphate GlcNAc-1-phosphate transferase